MLEGPGTGSLLIWGVPLHPNWGLEEEVVFVASAHSQPQDPKKLQEERVSGSMGISFQKTGLTQDCCHCLNARRPK
jgi:hypothetical protein